MITVNNEGNTVNIPIKEYNIIHLRRYFDRFIRNMEWKDFS